MKFSFRTNVDVLNLHVGRDGTSDQPCWFCGGNITVPEEADNSGLALLTIEPMGEGERVHTVCHLECAQRSKGSLRF
jgi:hypothetical protein